MSVTQISAFHRPTDVAAAWALLAEGGAGRMLVAGGSDVMVRCPADVRELIDLSLAGLDGIRTEPDGRLRVGATTTFTQMLEDPRIEGYGTGVVHEMLGQLGSVLHRNSATIGGHVARARMSDVIPVLLAVDAEVVIHDGVERHLPLAEHIAEDHGPHVITAVTLPVLPARSAAAFGRFSRSTFDHALLNVCCRVDLDDDGAVADARVVLGEPKVLGRRLAEAERTLVGSPISEEHIADVVAATRAAIASSDDWIATAEYRRHLAGVLVDRALRTIADRLQGDDR
jgi:CO/xanthine dehydrogenase FAD-binding subunit